VRKDKEEDDSEEEVEEEEEEEEEDSDGEDVVCIDDGDESASYDEGATVDDGASNYSCDHSGDEPEPIRPQKKRRTDTYTTNEFQKPKYVVFHFSRCCMFTVRSFVRTFGKSVGLPSKWKQDVEELERIANQPNAPRLLRVHKTLRQRLIDLM